MSEAEQEVAGEEVSAPTRSTHPFHRGRPSSPRYASSPGPIPAPSPRDPYGTRSIPLQFYRPTRFCPILPAGPINPRADRDADANPSRLPDPSTHSP